MSVHPSVRIHPTARVAVHDLTIGAGGVVGARCVIEGHRVTIGRELWMDEGAVIGGGSCNDPMAFLDAGDFLHLGRASQLNTARGVTLSDEVGIGIESKVFSHGAYLDELAGFPVAFAPVCIGSRVWLPSALVLPGVTIGDDVVVGAMSLVNRDLPSGCLAAGVPARVIREHAFPRALTEAEERAILERIAGECNAILGGESARVIGPAEMEVAGARFVMRPRSIVGPATHASEALRGQLRRHGIRFRCSPIDGNYQPWPESSR